MFIKNNVILIGFMGTGKTSVGRLLASKLCYSFVDIDEEIEMENGLTIPNIFASKGEKIFRELEKIEIKKICRRTNLVIATGGGSVLDKENFLLLKNSGIMISLTAAPIEIFRRTKAQGGRPLLNDNNEEQLSVIKNLLATREKFYAGADYEIDTTEKTLSQVTENIQRYLRKSLRWSYG